MRYNQFLVEDIARIFYTELVKNNTEFIKNFDYESADIKERCRNFALTVIDLANGGKK